MLVMAIANQEEGQFSSELGHILLTDTQVQNTFLTNIIAEAKRVGYGDVHFDLERILASDKEAYNQFLRIARDRLHQEGIIDIYCPCTEDKREPKRENGMRRMIIKRMERLWIIP